jgi:hypothetical protein
MKKKKTYDLYKCYGLLKTMQEKVKEVEKLYKEVVKELNCSGYWENNIEIHYNNEDLTIEDVKEICDEFFNKGIDEE